MSGTFRNIRPSFGDSSGTPNQSTPESTGPDPRRNGAEKEIAESSTTSSKRRRVPESVTRNACLNCKKARAKCDGKKPCKRCASRVETSECIYETHVKHAKEELVRQIKDLKAKDHLSEQILSALSSDEHVPEILDKLKHGEQYEAIVEWLGRSTVDEYETLSPKESHHSAFEAEDHEMGGVSGPGRWTTVVTDPATLDHLFQLYFAWVHPVHTLFSEGHFVDSYQRLSDTFCSSVLVNAICAMACHLHTNAEGDDSDYYEQLLGEFTDAVRRDIIPNDRSITTVQAFAVLFLLDCAGGQALRATSYLQIATAGLSEISESTYSDNDSNTVWKATVCGIRNLNIEWAQMTFQVSPTVLSATYNGFEENDDKLDNARWYCYRFLNDNVTGRTGLLATTNREKGKLLAIVRETTHMLYSWRTAQLSAHDIMQQYRRLVSWREELPMVIGDARDIKSAALPHVLTLLITFECSVIQLLRPLLNFEGFPSPMIEEIIWKHAQNGLSLVAEQYESIYTCRYQCVVQMFAVLHLSDIIARFFPGGAEGDGLDGPDAIQLGINALKQSQAGFPVAGPFRDLLRRTALELSILLPENSMELSNKQQVAQKQYRMDDFIGACTRLSYDQPTRAIHLRYLSSMSADWAANGASFGFLNPVTGMRSLRAPTAEERGAQSLMQIRNLLNS